MKNLVLRSLVASQYSDKDSVVVELRSTDLPSRNSRNSSSLVTVNNVDLNLQAKRLAKYFGFSKVVIQYVDEKEMKFDIVNDDTLVVILVPGVTKRDLVNSLTKFLTERKNTLIRRILRWLGDLLGLGGSFLDTMVNLLTTVIDAILDNIIFSNQRDKLPGIGFKKNEPTLSPVSNSIAEVFKNRSNVQDYTN